MRLYDTASGSVISFDPGAKVGIYVCGITPYDSAHIGHAAVFLAFDVLRRYLEDSGVEVRLVRNITDVDDDILRKARQLGVHYLDLAVEEVARFDADMDALGLLPPDSAPRATSAIADILKLIDAVIDRGYAYQAGGAVYFEVARCSRYGHLSHLDRQSMLALAAERGGNPKDRSKRDPLDFVLWQPSAPDEPAWESRWGPGRPGWHVECSALALREIGTTVDIHGGGSDLIFPHHECESAQSEAVTGVEFVRHWMHAGMVRLGGEKMSKSLGNLVFVSDLRKQWDPAVIRLAILSRHYRESWEWDPGMLEVAAGRLARWRATGAGTAGLNAVRERLADDLDVPGAIAAIDEAAGAGFPGPYGGVASAAALLGVI